MYRKKIANKGTFWTQSHLKYSILVLDFCQ
jgi:hypothetical protein